MYFCALQHHSCYGNTAECIRPKGAESLHDIKDTKNSIKKNPPGGGLECGEAQFGFQRPRTSRSSTNVSSSDLPEVSITASALLYIAVRPARMRFRSSIASWLPFIGR